MAFLINTLVVQYGLAEPLSGALPEEAKQEMQDVEFRIKNLKREPQNASLCIFFLHHFDVRCQT